MANPGLGVRGPWVLFVISWNNSPLVVQVTKLHQQLMAESLPPILGTPEPFWCWREGAITSFVWVIALPTFWWFTCKEIYVIQTDGGWDLMHDFFLCQVHLSGLTRWIGVWFFKLTVYQVFCALQKTTVEFCNMSMMFVPLVSYQTCVVLFLNFVETLCYGEVSLPSGMHWMLGGSVKSQT